MVDGANYNKNTDSLHIPKTVAQDSLLKAAIKQGIDTLQNKDRLVKNLTTTRTTAILQKKRLFKKRRENLLFAGSWYYNAARHSFKWRKYCTI